MKLSKIFNFKAFLYHFCFSFALIGGLAFFILKTWYPGIWASELGGYKLVVMILLVDLCVGPLCVGLAYKVHKSRKEKFFDISVITLCQLAFFAWGAWTVSISRPVFIVFDTDRFELVVDQDVNKDALIATSAFNEVPLFKGIQMAVLDLAATVSDADERIEINNDSIFGLDISKFPKYYVAYQGENLQKVLNMAKDYDALSKNEVFKVKVDEVIAKHQLGKDQFKWLPLRYFSPQLQSQQFLTAVIDPQSAEIIDYILLDPYEI